MSTIIKIENLSKQYRLGVVGSRTLSGDAQRLWAKLRGKEDPFLKIGEENKLSSKAGEYVWALRDINLDINAGEVLGIIGKNGAGKSTLLKILSRVTGPTTGSIKTRGRIASLLEVGTGFHPELTGRENTFLNGAILGMTRHEIKRKLDEIVAFAGVEKYLDTPVKRYSSGMYVRLAFAVAAHLEPEILVVDEVLAVGDAEFQQKAIGKMRSVSESEGRTVLFVSHNMASIQSLCTQATLLLNGKIAALGYPEKIIEDYLYSKTEKDKSDWINSARDFSKPVELLHVKILDEEKKIRNKFQNTEEIIIELLVHVRQPDKYLKLGIEVLENGWKKLFTSFHNDISENNLLKQGDNLIQFVVPKNLLNKGHYTCNIICGIHRVRWLFEYYDLVSFTVNFNVMNKLMPVDSRPGCVIAPLINCNIF